MATTLSSAAKSRQHEAAHRRLEIEADERHLFGDGRAMLDQLGFGNALHGSQAEQSGVEAEAHRKARLLDRLVGAPGEASDEHERP